MSALCLGRWPFYFSRGDLRSARDEVGEPCAGCSVTRRCHSPSRKERASRAGGRVRPAELARPEPGRGEPGLGRRTRGGGGVWPLPCGRGSRAWCGRPGFPEVGDSPRLNRVVAVTPPFPRSSFAQKIPDPLVCSPSLWLLCYMPHIHTRIRLVFNRFCLVSFS